MRVTAAASHLPLRRQAVVTPDVSTPASTPSTNVSHACVCLCCCRSQPGTGVEPHQRPTPLQPSEQQQQRSEPCQRRKLCIRADRCQSHQQLGPGAAPEGADQLHEQRRQQRPHPALTYDCISCWKPVWRSPSQEGRKEVWGWHLHRLACRQLGAMVSDRLTRATSIQSLSTSCAMPSAN